MTGLNSLTSNFYFFDNGDYGNYVNYTNLGVTVFVVMFFTTVSLNCLFFRTNSVLEVIFWAELLLITSIFGIASLFSVCSSSLGNTFGIFLLGATAAEAAVGMFIILEAGNRGISQNFKTLNQF